MPKVLALDLDGTLFYPKKRIRMIPKKNINFIRRFIDEGNKVVLCSGRNLPYALKVQEKLQRNIDVIGCNSSFIYSNGEIIKSSAINGAKIEFIVKEFIEKYGIKVWLLMSKDQSLVIAGDMNTLTRWLYTIIYFSQGIYAEKYIISNDAFDEELKKGEIYKLMIFFGLGKKAKDKACEANKYIRENYKDILEASWTDNFIELTAANVSKSNGLKDYCEINNIDPKDVYVAGDSGNDISMFNTFYEHSFCMKHSPAKVKKFAKYQIRRVADIEKLIKEIE
ncbi:MAG: HAD-IIB family hydrolase [Erysipelotrichales bacterium]|nr:HAD-IIB family hydrolase [Erysipelotrichales bacterium]